MAGSVKGRAVVRAILKGLFLALTQYLRNISCRVNDPDDLQRFCLWTVHNPIIPVGLHKPEAQRQEVRSSRIRRRRSICQKAQPAWIASSTRLAASRSFRWPM